MFGFFLGATLFAGVAGFRLFILSLQRLKVERYYVALACVLLLFEIFNAATFAALLFLESRWQNFLLRSFGYLFLLLPPAGALLAMPLVTSKRNRALLALAVSGPCLVLMRMHAHGGLWQVLHTSEAEFVIALTAAGKFFFAGGIIGTAALLGRLEAITLALEWRTGKRNGLLNTILLLLLLALLLSCSTSLIYGRLEHIFWPISQSLCGLLCFVLAHALKSAQPTNANARPITTSAARVLSSNVLIYAGVYCLAFGVLVKLAMLLGGSWSLFVSFFTALGAVVLALVLLTENAWQQRWSRFVGRYWRAKKYDFRIELQQLNEKISAVEDETEQARAFCNAIQGIFAAAYCRLWMRHEHGANFAVVQSNSASRSAHPETTLSLSPKQIAWLERVNEGFGAEQLLLLEDRHDPGAKLLQDCACLVALHAGPNLIGLMGLGPKDDGQAYDEEDRQLLDLLVTAASLALHTAHLQQRMHAIKQTESIYRMASFMTHDLRHAVGALTLLAHNAKAHLDKPDFRADFLASLERVSHEMQTLMQRLSAVKTGGESSQFGACDATQLINEVIADAQIMPPIIIDVQIDTLPQVWWDKEQVRVVLRNLLVNACEAMPHGGALQVRAHSDENNVQIIVRDEGVGMSSEFIQHRLFRPNQSTKAKGLGIGLYQSREIARAHRGEIYVESELGKGTKFEIVLPHRPDPISHGQIS